MQGGDIWSLGHRREQRCPSKGIRFMASGYGEKTNGRKMGLLRCNEYKVQKFYEFYFRDVTPDPSLPDMEN
jgi:hypothetical protein